MLVLCGVFSHPFCFSSVRGCFNVRRCGKENGILRSVKLRKKINFLWRKMFFFFWIITKKIILCVCVIRGALIFFAKLGILSQPRRPPSPPRRLGHQNQKKKMMLILSLSYSEHFIIFS